MTKRPTCTCPDVETTLRGYLADEPPPCDLHNPQAPDASTGPAPLALNNDAGLIDNIGRALGVTPSVTTSTYPETL